MLTLLCDAASAGQTILNIVLALVVLMFMILVHELGHYTAGKLLKFKINEFAVGMGPKVLSKTKKNGEVISLRALPLGGFCAFEGEDEDAENSAAFNNQKPWKRLIVLFAGAFFNFVSAVLIAVVVFSCFGDTVMVVKDVYDYAASENQVLESGDIITKVDGKNVYIAGDFSYYIKNDKFDLTVLRNGKEVELKGLVRRNYVLTEVNTVGKVYTSDDYTLSTGDTLYKIDGKAVCGEGAFAKLAEQSGDTVNLTVITKEGKHVEFSDVDKKTFMDSVTFGESSYRGLGIASSYSKMKYGFGDSLLRAVPYCFEVAWLVLRTLGGLLTGVVGIDQVGGPISTIGMASQVVSTGFGNVLSMIVMISVNLAVFNLLPVPALDGCKMIFVIIEWIARKPVNRKVEAYINGIGFILLLVFMVLIDILKL